MVWWSEMTAVDIGALAREGYLPVAIRVREGRLILRSIGREVLSEPFYDQTVRRLQAQRTAEISFNDFVSASHDLPQTGPHHLMGHTGRCGSTLLTNLLALDGRLLVLKEPGFLEAAVSLALADGKDVLSPALLKYLAHAAGAQDRQLVLKTTSWTTPHLLAEFAPQPTAKWLLMWRDPASVVSSELAVPPHWAREDALVHLTSLMGIKAPSGTTGDDDARLGLLAEIWRAIAASFVAAATHVQSVAVLDYDTVAADPLAAVTAAKSWFGILNGDASEPAEYRKTASRYSKSQSGEAYDPRGAHRRPALAAGDCRRIDAITGPDCAALRQCTRGLATPSV
jgi:hypothetical protein